MAKGNAFLICIATNGKGRHFTAGALDKKSFPLRISSVSDQIRRKLRVWLHLLKNSLLENFIFCSVGVAKGNPFALSIAETLIKICKFTKNAQWRRAQGWMYEKRMRCTHLI